MSWVGGTAVTSQDVTKYRAIFLDVGDTLVHADPSWAEVIIDVASLHGITISLGALSVAERELAPQLAARFARGARCSFTADTARAHWSWVYRHLLESSGASEELVGRVAERCHERFTTLTTWKLFADVRPLFAALDVVRASGIHVAVLSNWEGWLDRLLAHLAIADHFDALTISGWVGSEKPDQAIFDHALHGAGLDRASSHLAVHVGDSWDADVVGARSVGINPVLLDRNGRSDAARRTSTTVIATLSELPSIIRNGTVRP